MTGLMLFLSRKRPVSGQIPRGEPSGREKALLPQSPAREESEPCVDAVTINYKRHPQNPRRSLGPRFRVSGSSRPAFARPPPPPPTDPKRITEGASEGTLLGHRVSQPIWGAPGGQDPGRTASSVYPSDPAAFPASRLGKGGWGKLEVKNIRSSLLTPRSARRQSGTRHARRALRSLGATRLGCGIHDTRRKEISPIHWLPGGV